MRSGAEVAESVLSASEGAALRSQELYALIQELSDARIRQPTG